MKLSPKVTKPIPSSTSWLSNKILDSTLSKQSHKSATVHLQSLNLSLHSSNNFSPKIYSVVKEHNRKIARSNHVHVWTSSFSSVETPLLYTSCQLTFPLRQRCHLSPSFSLSVRNRDCKLIMTKFNFQPFTTTGFPADAIFLYRNSNGHINS